MNAEPVTVDLSDLKELAAVQFRPTRAVVDLGAITHNVAEFVRIAAPSLVCAVVKADGYGHGAVQSAKAALRGGATWLAVAMVEEAIELRRAGITAPILLLSEFPLEAASAIVQLDLTATVYSSARIQALHAAAVGLAGTVNVHVKIDTGMNRVGVQPGEVVALVAELAACSVLRHRGTFTHFAIADAPGDPYTEEQVHRFNQALDALRTAGFDPGIVHAANSAGSLAHDMARLGMVRLGVSMYGNDPDSALPAYAYNVHLQPVLSLLSAVSHVKVVPAGSRISYGLRHEFRVDSVVATVPIGYADGVPRSLSANGGEVLIGGRRMPIVGRVTMDQIMVDCGPVTSVEVPNTEGDLANGARTMPVAGDEVVLLGTQGNESITPWDWALMLDTIAYEITCGLTKRVPRLYTGE
jgi:alanine racemase